MRVRKGNLILVVALATTFFLFSNYLPIDASSGSFLSNLQFGRLLTKAGFGTNREDALIVVGDVMLGRDVEKKMRDNGLNHPFLYVKNYLNARVTLGNFEAAIPEVHQPTPALGMVFSVVEDNLESAVNAGFTHFSLANNHTYDHGSAGLTHTKKALDRYGFKFFGDPKSVSSNSVVYVSVGDVPAAIIALNAVSGYPKETEWKPILEMGKHGSDLQIVYIHWGEEYEASHNWAQEKFAYALVDAGADVVIGHHPHVVQDVEEYNGAIIFYSLGNFVFDQYFSEDVQIGLTLRIELYRGRGEITLFPVDSRDSQASPRVMNGEAKQLFLQKLARKSSTSLSKPIEEGLLEFSF